MHVRCIDKQMFMHAWCLHWIYRKVVYSGFKDRLYEHTTNMNNKHQKQTKLSSHVWKLKDRGKDYTIKWRILDRAATFNPITRKCRVCLKEKFYIMYDRAGSTLNKRHEVFNSCIHRCQKLLENFETWAKKISFRYRKQFISLCRSHM